MQLVKELGIISLALVMSGCSVLGVATDMALFSASEDNQTPGDPRHGKSTELIFTKEGLKQDAKVVKKIMDELSDSNNDFTPVFKEDPKAKSLACKNVKDGQQQCYPPEYYKDMYIEDSGSKEDNVKSDKD